MGLFFAINSKAQKTANIQFRGNFPLYEIFIMTGSKVSHVLKISCMHKCTSRDICNTCCSAERCHTVIGVTVTFLLTVILYTALLLVGCAVWRRVQIGKTK